MQFWKMNGAGNDLIILNNIQEGLPAEAFPVLARTLCTPHRSLGADGFMVVEPAQGEGDFRMGFYNSDGSLGEMCGNGARCICRYGYETGLAGETQRVETWSPAGGSPGGSTRSASTTPPPSPSRRNWRPRGKPGPAPMWSWATPVCPTRWCPIPAWPGRTPRPCSAWAGPCGTTPGSPRGPT